MTTGAILKILALNGPPSSPNALARMLSKKTDDESGSHALSGARLRTRQAQIR